MPLQTIAPSADFPIPASGWRWSLPWPGSGGAGQPACGMASGRTPFGAGGFLGHAPAARVRALRGAEDGCTAGDVDDPTWCPTRPLLVLAEEVLRFLRRASKPRGDRGGFAPFRSAASPMWPPTGGLWVGAPKMVSGSLQESL